MPDKEPVKDANKPDPKMDQPKVDTSAKPTGSPVTTASEPPKNPPPGPQSTKSLVPGTNGSIKDPDEQPRHAVSDNTPSEQAQPDPNAAELSRDEEAQLERILDNDDPDTDPNRPAVARGHEPSAITKIRRIVAAIPQDTPNEHVVWGAAGTTLTIGDFRELVRAIA